MIMKQCETMIDALENAGINVDVYAEEFCNQVALPPSERFFGELVEILEDKIREEKLIAVGTLEQMKWERYEEYSQSEEIRYLAKQAMPIDSDDWGSERQVAAEIAFWIEAERIINQKFGADIFSELELWGLEATIDELIDEAMLLINMDMPKYLVQWLEGYGDAPARVVPFAEMLGDDWDLDKDFLFLLLTMQEGQTHSYYDPSGVVQFIKAPTLKGE
jgi:hypothetical protein